MNDMRQKKIMRISQEYLYIEEEERKKGNIGEG